MMIHLFLVISSVDDYFLSASVDYCLFPRKRYY
jgi:hypothetical protein